jgi:hypothetical protein
VPIIGELRTLINRQTTGIQRLSSIQSNPWIPALGCTRPGRMQLKVQKINIGMSKTFKITSLISFVVLLLAIGFVVWGVNLGIHFSWNDRDLTEKYGGYVATCDYKGVWIEAFDWQLVLSKNCMAI